MIFTPLGHNLLLLYTQTHTYMGHENTNALYIYIIISLGALESRGRRGNLVLFHNKIIKEFL